MTLRIVRHTKACIAIKNQKCNTRYRYQHQFAINYLSNWSEVKIAFHTPFVIVIECNQKWNSNKKNWKEIERFFLLILKDYYITIVVFLLSQYFILLLAVCQNNEKLKSRKIDWNCRILFVSFVRKMCINGWSGNCPNRSWGSWFCLFRRERELRECTDVREKRTERKLRGKCKLSEKILKIADFWSAFPLQLNLKPFPMLIAIKVQSLLSE